MCTKMACLISGRRKDKLRIKRELIASKIKIEVGKLSQMSDDEFMRLPALLHQAAECTPFQKYKVDCNACICDEEAILVCESNMCVDKDSTRQILAAKETGKTCRNSYTTKDCIKCSCLNGTTKCGPTSDCNTGDIEMLSHAVTDKRLTFDFTKEDCIPNVVYKDGCNKCYCQKDKTLRCTRKMCLNNKQAKELEEQREYLEQRGL